jgi:hypothetical protein
LEKVEQVEAKLTELEAMIEQAATVREAIELTRKPIL